MAQYRLHVPGFKGREPVLDTGNWRTGAFLIEDGKRPPRAKRRGWVVLHRNDGKPVEARIRARAMGLDPVPNVEVEGEVVSLEPPLKWYQWAWIALPVLLVFVGGALGVAFGTAGTAVNARLMRSERPTRTRYGLTALVSVATAALFFAVALGVRLALEQF